MSAGAGGGAHGYSFRASDSTFNHNNSVLGGGGISSFYATVVDSIVRENSVRGDTVEGAGISAGYGILWGSVVSENIATGTTSADGGGLSGHTFSIENSTVSGNIASGPKASGGGISVNFSYTINSTVSGNTASGSEARGGGLWGYQIHMTSSTVSGNSAEGIVSAGGGVWGDDGSFYEDTWGEGIVTLRNSIVLGNSASAGGPQDEVSVSTELALIGGNILGGDRFNGGNDVGDISAAEVFAGVTEIAPGVFAGLLGDNGGPTPTIAIRRGGPAAGAADPALIWGTTETDQRGTTRDAAPDLGAYEATNAGLVLVGGLNADFLTGDALNDRLRGREGDDVLRGLGGDDVILGDWGADTIRGGGGNDDINGGAGDDWIAGGAGDDRLNGGAGADLFVFGESFGVDTIVGFDGDPFGGQDLIDLRGLGITAASFAVEVAIRDLVLRRDHDPARRLDRPDWHQRRQQHRPDGLPARLTGPPAALPAPRHRLRVAARASARADDENARTLLIVNQYQRLDQLCNMHNPQIPGGRLRSSVIGNSRAGVSAGGMYAPGRMSVRLEPRQPARFRFVAVDREGVVAPPARMRDVIDAAADRPPAPGVEDVEGQRRVAPAGPDAATRPAARP